MYNFLGLTNAVNKRLNEVELTPSNFDTIIGVQADVKNYINLSINRINREQFEWPFNHTYQEVVLVDGQNRYNYPLDAKSIAFDTFVIKPDVLLNIEAKRLRVLDYEEYLEKHLDKELDISGTKNVPEMIVRNRNSSFTVVPAPDAAYTLRYEYYKLPVDLMSWDSVPTVPEFFKEVIIEGAMYYAYTFKGAIEEADRSNKLFQDGIKQMRTIFLNRTEYVRSSVIRG